MKSLAFFAVVCLSLALADTCFAQNAGKGKRGETRLKKQDQQSQSGEQTQRRRRRGQDQGRRGGARNLDRFFGFVDKDQDGSISLDEAPQRMKQRFSDIDANSDSKISREELKQALATMRGGRGQGQRDGKGNKGEKGSKGKQQKGAMDQQGANGQGMGRRRMGNAASLFASLDKDGDGKISKDEAPGRLKTNFDKMDTDQSGAASLEEFTDLLERRQAGASGAVGRNRGDAGTNKKAQKPKRPPMETEGA